MKGANNDLEEHLNSEERNDLVDKHNEYVMR